MFKVLKPSQLGRQHSVSEVEYEGNKCVAKFFLESLDVEQDLHVLLDLKHSNIVRYIGIKCHPLYGKALLREFVHDSLTSYLKKPEYQAPSLIVEVDLAHDISKGLTFLHSKHITHGNLTCNNVLITQNGIAKLSDFGMMSCNLLRVLCQRDRNYLSPKMRASNPDQKMDEFSFGILSIQILNRQVPLLMSRSPTSNEDGYFDCLHKLTDKIESLHPLLSVIKGCIEPEATLCRRPEIKQIKDQIDTIVQSRVYREMIELHDEKQKLKEDLEKQETKIEEYRQQPLSLPSKKWIRQEQAPLEMRRSADSVTDGHNVYIRLSHNKKVLVFNLNTKKWDKALNSRYFRSSLAMVDGKLVAIGGTENQADATPSTDEIIRLDGTNVFPLWGRMQKPRSRCTSITCQNREDHSLLIIAGGEDPVGTTLKTVEILNVTTKSWSFACSLPQVRYSCSAAIVNNNIYILGGWIKRQEATRKVLTCSIDSLLKSSVSSPPSESPTAIWEELDAELPVAQATCASFNNQLLVFGGTWCECYKCSCSVGKASSVIYSYNEDSEQFESIGCTPHAQYLCFASVFHINKIFIAGGAENPEMALKDAYIYTS